MDSQDLQNFKTDLMSRFDCDNNLSKYVQRLEL